MKALSADAATKALQNFPAWKISSDGKSIMRKFIFTDFSEAFGFMARTALVAEKMDHHPDWSNVYKTVEVTLSTHDASGLTDKDFALAAAMDRIAG